MEYSGQPKREENGAWVFLRGVSDVNRDAHENGTPSSFSTFIREYSAEQYRIRFGETTSHI